MYTPCFSLIHISTSTHLASSNDLHSYLNHFSVDPLPHFNSTVSHQHRPIQINVNQGSSLSKKKKKQLSRSFWLILSYILSNRRYFPWEVTPPFHLCRNTHRHLPHCAEQSQGKPCRAGPACRWMAVTLGQVYAAYATISSGGQLRPWYLQRSLWPKVEQ